MSDQSLLLIGLFLIFGLGVCAFQAVFFSDWKPFVRAVREWRAEREARRHDLRLLHLRMEIKRGYEVADEARRQKRLEQARRSGHAFILAARVARAANPNHEARAALRRAS